MLTGAAGFLGTELAARLAQLPGVKICALVRAADEAEGKTFHLTCPNSAAPRAGELAEYVRDWARKNPELPDNLYVADASILPKALGNPPILTIMALAKKIAGLLLKPG